MHGLGDAEWRFGVTVAADDVARVGSTFLQMRLKIDGVPDAGQVGGRPASGAAAAPPAADLRAEHQEVAIPQFYDLPSQLEKAQSYALCLGQTA